MKKIIIVAILLLTIIGTSWLDTHYTRENCEVISYVENVVTVEDFKGRTWEFTADGLEVGDVVDLKMHTNNSDSNIFDDKVLGYKLVSDWREVE